MFAIRELREKKMVKPPSAHTPTKSEHTYRWFTYFKVSN
jgi:hypothetical protein